MWDTTHLSGLPGTCRRRRHLLALWICSSLMRISLCRARHQSWATVVFRFFDGKKTHTLRTLFLRCSVTCTLTMRAYWRRAFVLIFLHTNSHASSKLRYVIWSHVVVAFLSTHMWCWIYSNTSIRFIVKPSPSSQIESNQFSEVNELCRGISYICSADNISTGWKVKISHLVPGQYHSSWGHCAH